MWVALTRFGSAELARLKKIAGARWNPERRRWQLPDTPATRAALAEIVATPPASPNVIAVKPKQANALVQKKPTKRYLPGKDKPLTTNPPHPLIKQVDDELVLRGMAYGTRKAYGQHLRNFFDWLKEKHIVPEQAMSEQIRAYLVAMASSGKYSAAYCRGARSALIFLYEVVLKQRGKAGDLPRMKRPQQLPRVLSREEIAKIRSNTESVK